MRLVTVVRLVRVVRVVGWSGWSNGQDGLVIMFSVIKTDLHRKVEQYSASIK